MKDCVQNFCRKTSLETPVWMIEQEVGQ